MSPENIAKQILYLGYFMSMLFTFLGIPMAWKLISPNPWYGVRTEATLNSIDVWYQVNSNVGWILIVSGIISTVFIYLLRNLTNSAPVASILLNSFMPLLIPAIGLLIFWLIQ